jgi:hypothetical protein
MTDIDTYDICHIAYLSHHVLTNLMSGCCPVTQIVLPGEISEIVGRRSAGRTSVLVAYLADVTRSGGVAALIDAEDAFDVESAARAGVALRRLLWVRCGQGPRRVALRAVDMLLRCRGFSLIAWDTGDTVPRLPMTVAFRLRLAAHRSETPLLIVAPRRIAGAAAALAVEARAQGTRWEGTPAPARLDRVRIGLEVIRSRKGREGASAEPWELWA